MRAVLAHKVKGDTGDADLLFGWEWSVWESLIALPIDCMVISTTRLGNVLTLGTRILMELELLVLVLIFK